MSFFNQLRECIDFSMPSNIFLNRFCRKRVELDLEKKKPYSTNNDRMMEKRLACVHISTFSKNSRDLQKNSLLHFREIKKIY